MMDPLRDDAIAEAQEKVKLGDEAIQFLRSEVVKGFFENLDNHLVDALLDLPTDDDAGRYKLAVAARTVRNLWTGFQKAAAEREINYKNLVQLLHMRDMDEANEREALDG